MTDYIKTMRGLVGHRPLIQCGASVILEDAQGHILLQKRKDNHCWGYAGGSVELDEAVEDAAKRELLEETGLVAETLELLQVPLCLALSRWRCHRVFEPIHKIKTTIQRQIFRNSALASVGIRQVFLPPPPFLAKNRSAVLASPYLWIGS